VASLQTVGWIGGEGEGTCDARRGWVELILLEISAVGVDIDINVDVLVGVGRGGGEIPHAGLQRGGTRDDCVLFPFPFTFLLFVLDVLLLIHACACASEDTVVGSSKVDIGGGSI